MPFHSYDALTIFDRVARHASMTAAATELHLSKGSISYQIHKLEDDLGFALFVRERQRLRLTEKGEKLWQSVQLTFGQLDRDIRELQRKQPAQITIGALTYFFSRWLSSRLTNFMENNSEIAVRVEPITGIADLTRSEIDVAVCWGVGEWTGYAHEVLFPCPAVPTANARIATRVAKIGLERALREIPLLSDSSGSLGWVQWHRKAGLSYQPMDNRLVIPDSNDRVQAVVDGQGIALWDALVQNELNAGVLRSLSDTTLDEAGYFLVYPSADANRSDVVDLFADWIKRQV